MSPSMPPFIDEHEDLRASIRGFIERELAPHAQQWEEDRWFPDEVFTKMAAQGLLGLKYPGC
jgi:alkylation response protein AidB-like acyl-CoA dehydrogenase